jgi:hypothetical protein
MKWKRWWNSRILGISVKAFVINYLQEKKVKTLKGRSLYSYANRITY